MAEKPKVRQGEIAGRLVYRVEFAGAVSPWPSWEGAMDWANILAEDVARREREKLVATVGPGPWVIAYKSPRGLLYMKNPLLARRHLWTALVGQAYGWSTYQEADAERGGLVALSDSDTFVYDRSRGNR